MSDGVRVDVIYLNISSDWLFESELYSKRYSLRLLTSTASSRMEALKNLSRAVSRSETVIVVGGWQKENYLPAAIAKAVGLNCQKVGLPGWTAEQAVLLPSGSIPLTLEGRIRGAILCRGPQAIVMIDDEREGRVKLVKEFVVPYLMKQVGAVEQTEKVAPRPEQSVKPESDPAPTEPVSSVADKIPESRPQKPMVSKTPEQGIKTPADESEHIEQRPKTAEKKTPVIETIPMRPVRLKAASKRPEKAVGLPELKFANSLDTEQKAERKPSETPLPAKAPEEIPMSFEPEPPAQEKKRAASVPPEDKKSPPTVKKTVVKKAATVSETAPVSAEVAVETEEDGIDLPRPGKVLTAVLVLILLAALGAVLYVGYQLFVLGDPTGAALAALENICDGWI